MCSAVNAVIVFQRVTTGCLRSRSPENDRVELSDTLARLVSVQQRLAAAAGTLGVFPLQVLPPTLRLRPRRRDENRERRVGWGRGSEGGSVLFHRYKVMIPKTVVG